MQSYFLFQNLVVDVNAAEGRLQLEHMAGQLCQVEGGYSVSSAMPLEARRATGRLLV